MRLRLGLSEEKLRGRPDVTSCADTGHITSGSRTADVTSCADTGHVTPVAPATALVQQAKQSEGGSDHSIMGQIVSYLMSWISPAPAISTTPDPDTGLSALDRKLIQDSWALVADKKVRKANGVEFFVR